MSFDSAFGYNFDDLRALAKRRLPHGLFEFVDRGTEDDLTIRNNFDAFRRIQLFPRPLVDVSKRSLTMSLFGKEYPMPVCLAPTGAAGLLWHEGEVAAAAAAAAFGIPYSMSTGSITSIEKVAEKAGGELWFQLYLWPDPAMSLELVRRARDAGYKALIVTIDTTVTPNREFNYRNGFTVPMKLTRRNVADAMRRPRWAFGVMGRYLMSGGMPRFHNLPSALQRKMTDTRKAGLMPKNDSLTWDDLKRLRDMWDGPLIVKGILHPDDACAAVQAGADGIVVSNHGGRVLDNAPASIEMLPDVRQAVGSRTVVLLDSGIRRGSDVVKAIALGADAVMVGRMAMWGTAVGGQRGVAHALTLLRDEIDRVMAFTGCTSMADLNRACCARLP
ncbi:(S)-mandelate dehydrogenase [Achromobacter veterisilvae]|uniref:(S)-mandelate dehydrogenase n=1 Tax=Achromobacter veterisilvae TaxID=2069367 RepID=A0A446CI31_9BURK|nr:alpha-hydroxy acid oxidase [Achromobacter veterisilvae]SSW67566.1 (S)-mandelate dehydrogenase [Achromobacter veterisilvae]